MKTETPDTATEAAQAETPDEWRKRRSAELREEYRGAWPGLGSRSPFRVAILQSEEALWWGFERGLEELLGNPAVICAECDFDRRHQRTDAPRHDCPEKLRALLAHMRETSNGN